MSNFWDADPVAAPVAKGGNFWDADPVADHPSVAADIAKSAGTGLAKGVIGLAGLPGDAANLGKIAADYVGSKLPSIPSPAPDSMLGKGLQFLRDESAKTANLPAAQVGSGDLPGSYVPPTSDQLQKTVEGVTGDFHKPSTTAGQYAQTIGEFAPAALGGGEGLMARVAKQVVAPAVASETAGQATQGTSLEPYARVGAAIAGGGLASALSKTPELAAPSVDALKASYKAGIDHPDVKAVTFDPDSLADLHDTIRYDLEQRGFRDRRETNTFSDLNELSNTTPTMARAAGAPATVADVESVRKSLGKTAQELGPDFRPTPDAAAASVAVKHIDNWFNNLKQPDLLSGDISKAAPIMQNARGDYAAAMRAQDIQNKAGNAALQAGSSYSGGNINNATRQALRPLAKNDFAKASGYSDSEQAQLSKAIMGNTIGNAARSVGKLAPDSGLKAMEHVAAAYASGGASIPASLATLAAKMAGDYATKRNVGKLDEMLRARSPLHQANLQNPTVNPALTAPSPPSIGRSALVNALLSSTAPRLQSPQTVNAP
jgi:hypothetical protein